MHTQRNAESHTAPVIDDAHVLPGIHMATAMYLYSTMINITDMESGEQSQIYSENELDINSRLAAEPEREKRNKEK